MITANDLKVKGIKIIDEQMKEEDEVLISYRGKPKYIVIDFERYDRIRESELDKIYLETMDDIKNAKAHTSTAKELIERIYSEL